MEIFWPHSRTDWKEAVLSLNQIPVLQPFDDKVLIFLQSLSKCILQDLRYRQYPELIALAYWIRKTNVTGMKNVYAEETKGRYLRARGTVLQFAPSNVDTIFVYSWALSLLAGNRSLIRISRKQSEQTKLLLEAIEKCFCLPENDRIASHVVIISYDHNDEITKFLSGNCHVRVIWGGDQTIKAIRSTPLAPLATEVVFPDRFSLSVFKADSVLSTDAQEMKQLIHNFYNDSFWFGQMACSSPRLIVWEGSGRNIQQAQEIFWRQFEQYVDENYSDYAPAIQVQKLTTALLYGVEEDVMKISNKSAMSRVQITNLTDPMREEHCGGGLFLEWCINSLQDLPNALQDKDQTLTYFGYDRKEFVDLVDRLPNRGIDRIVPVGQALNFEEVWDGYRLLTYFTREINIK